MLTNIKAIAIQFSFPALSKLIHSWINININKSICFIHYEPKVSSNNDS